MIRRALSTHEKGLRMSDEENKENIDRNRDRNGGRSGIESGGDKFFSDVIDFEMEKNIIEDRNNI